MVKTDLHYWPGLLTCITDHVQNLERNQKHYSLLGRLGSKAVRFLNPAPTT